MSLDQRRAMQCGWMGRSEWLPDDGSVPPYELDGELQKPDVCPGWLVRQPLVIEIGDGVRAARLGVFSAAQHDPANVVVQGVIDLDGRLKAHEAEELKKKPSG